MRKLALFLTLMMGVGFIACEQEGLDTNDPLYPSPEAVFVDDDACGGSTITLVFLTAALLLRLEQQVLHRL